MKISKQDALNWFRFFAELPEDEPLGCRQQEIALAVFAQIETAVDTRRRKMLESIPGLSVSKDVEGFKKQVARIGCAIVGQTAELAPTDKVLYALRDVTATVDCQPLIISSILSKKPMDDLCVPCSFHRSVRCRVPHERRLVCFLV